MNYSETDQMGVVYHARYLVWLDVARTEHLRHCGMSYRELEAAGLRLAVSELAVRYRQPARYDDLVRIRCWVRELASRGGSTFGYAVEHADDGRLLATATYRAARARSPRCVSTRLPDAVQPACSRPIPDPVGLTLRPLRRLRCRCLASPVRRRAGWLVLAGLGRRRARWPSRSAVVEQLAPVLAAEDARDFQPEPVTAGRSWSRPTPWCGGSPRSGAGRIGDPARCHAAGLPLLPIPIPRCASRRRSRWASCGTRAGAQPLMDRLTGSPALDGPTAVEAITALAKIGGRGSATSSSGILGGRSAHADDRTTGARSRARRCSSRGAWAAMRR